MKLASSIVVSVVGLAVAWVVQYLFMPTFSLLFFDGYIYAAFVLVALSAALWAIRSVDSNSRLFLLPGLLGVAIVALAIAGAVLTSWSLLHAEAYRAQLGPEENTPVSASLPPLHLENAPLVSEDMAMRVAEKRLADVPALGSQVELSRPTKQVVRGELVWVSFLQFRGFSRYWADGKTPGYVVVSAVDPTRVNLVTKVGGKALEMRYLSSAYFGNNVERRLYTSGLRTVGFADLSEELDDQGNPYTVATLFEHSVGFDGKEAVGVATVDVQTGEVKQYSLKDAPAWIDRIQPESFIKEQAENRGYLVHGWLNWSDKDRNTVSTIDLVYAADGHADYYVGLTAVGKPMGLIGFMLVDSRTKKVKRYVLPGAAEKAATDAAEGVLPEKHYLATNPLPFMLNSTPTYAMTLRDATGIARAYALVSMRDTSKVVVADSLQAADRQYQMKLGQDRTLIQSSSSTAARTTNGVVELIGADTRNGSTLYYLTLDSAPGRIFMGSTDVSVEIALTKPGQKVAVEYESGDTQVTSLVKFDNLEIPNKPVSK
ncbi:hypothetical protein [Burkholderia cenocepacia]|uniref:hypothetical protein n=1 Tax=Burkholderia cenocepacia TaxID=95486 RepID=UPI00076C990A|nr:hypothetical protein [Burkholderia cenocepacia]KWU17928.1 hypothetical protein AS149_14740 [Burkholderia cenocepacia]